MTHYKFTMCLPKNSHIVVLSAILIFIFTIEASPVGNLDPIETALVENCLKNCEICENNFIDFLEGEFCSFKSITNANAHTLQYFAIPSSIGLEG